MFNISLIQILLIHLSNNLNINNMIESFGFIVIAYPIFMLLNVRYVYWLFDKVKQKQITKGDISLSVEGFHSIKVVLYVMIPSIIYHVWLITTLFYGYYLYFIGLLVYCLSVHLLFNFLIIDYKDKIYHLKQLIMVGYIALPLVLFLKYII